MSRRAAQLRDSPRPSGGRELTGGMRRACARVQPLATLGARVVLAVVWTGAALTKIGDPSQTVRAVRAYQLLPEVLVPTVGQVLPFVELGLALLLALGLATRLAAVTSAVMLTGFVGAVAAAAARGLQIDCGCFGGGGEVAAASYGPEIIRDVALVAVAVVVARWPRAPLSLDAVLVTTDEEEPDGCSSTDPGTPVAIGDRPRSTCPDQEGLEP